MERAVRALRPWFDWRSYRSLITLVVVSFAVFLWPLAYDVAVALFFMLPGWFRNALGQTALLGSHRCRAAEALARRSDRCVALADRSG